MDPTLQAILDQLGLRLDSGATATLLRQLEYVKSQTYDVLYPTLKARMFFPVTNEAGPGAEVIVYRQWDHVGMAEVIANYADDLSLAEATVGEFFQPVKSLGKAYQYSIQDLRRAALSGNQLDMRRARACREAHERTVDDIAAVGRAKHKMRGILNHPNIPVQTAATDGTSTRWVQGRTTPKSSALIQKDMHTAVNTVRSNTREIHSPETVLLPTFEFGYIAQAPVAVDNQTNILRSFLENNPFVQNIDSWYKLDTADVAGTGPRMFVYTRSPDVMTLEIPQDFEQFPPEARNLAFVVNTHSRIGGMIVYRPLANIYVDGI